MQMIAAASFLFIFIKLISSKHIYDIISALSTNTNLNVVTATIILLVLSVLIYRLYISKQQHEIYLVDFSCFKPPDICRVPYSTFVEHVSVSGIFQRESVELMEKVLKSSGLGEETYLPPALHMIPPSNTMMESMEEVRMVLFPAMESLLHKTRLRSQDIDILIVNCSGFCPIPSLTSILINRFKMRSDVKTFNLSGMGCCAGIVAVDTASRILKVHNNCNLNAVILSTEILSTGWYNGKEQSKLLLNCVFRMGAAAILLTNRREARNTSKYKLLMSRRTLTSFDDKSYLCAFRDEDSEGITGASLNSTVLEAASETMRASIRDLGTHILPLSEKLKYALLSVILDKYILPVAALFIINYKDTSAAAAAAAAAGTSIKKKAVSLSYVPNFKTVINHFCLPTSGRKIIREIGKTLRLDERDMEPALSTLHRFGNQSSSSWWYEMAYMEAKGRIKKGDKVWQLGLGTGLKCTNVVWESLITTNIINYDHRHHHSYNQLGPSPWDDCITRYPIIL